jgi:hypothetical protein
MTDQHQVDAPITRWHARVEYRTDAGAVDVEHDFEEIADLHDLIELGPHWDTIERIEIHCVNHITSRALTVEQSLKLRGGPSEC